MSGLDLGTDQSFVRARSSKPIIMFLAMVPVALGDCKATCSEDVQSLWSGYSNLSIHLEPWHLYLLASPVFCRR